MILSIPWVTAYFFRKRYNVSKKEFGIYYFSIATIALLFSIISIQDPIVYKIAYANSVWINYFLITTLLLSFLVIPILTLKNVYWSIIHWAMELKRKADTFLFKKDNELKLIISIWGWMFSLILWSIIYILSLLIKFSINRIIGNQLMEFLVSFTTFWLIFLYLTVLFLSIYNIFTKVKYEDI